MRKRVHLGISMLLAIIILASSLALPPKPVYACSCAISDSVSEALNRNDAVFDGTVVASHTPRKWFSFSQSSADPVTWTFEAHEVWKGKVAPRITVTSAQSSASCGFEFREGQRYIVYARGTGDSLEVSLCSRTTLTSAGGSDLVELGSGSIPPKPSSGVDGAEAFGISQVMILLGLIVVLAAAIYAGLRIKRQK
ncbi:hypothetical protein PAT3040_04028 [Paenibacillus agaridevorans]|uniref:Tissue inhibitor of metalloproteinase n=1 Tax=Paenibacillus agaridevorans TaxID=171404 RepID=A0A2R5F127_9BACL|nr:hypothetical protein [Paenibacillus agaridevorans]GBG09384.1 hypothetical protein PAT3040_04028 [Paenibacillus agaridevorans]